MPCCSGQPHARCRARRRRRSGRVRGRSEWYPSALTTIGLKVFSATKARDREMLGEAITTWIRAHREFEVFDKIVTQSSDAEFHCLAITVFYRTR
jgi:hypothetical protein